VSDPLWYQDAVFYQLRVPSFFDSDDDGVGDFRGLTSKLDYLQDLGVNTLWLLPFYPSPRRDDGYDISDYTSVHPEYGTLRDFKGFLREAHGRGLRVVTELVLNHTSDQHAWFQRARRAPAGSRQRDFYVWSDDAQRYLDARIIFTDSESSNWTWDPVAGSHFWHRFFHHQPDLNFENPDVRKSLFRVMDHWFDMGVDGVRLDAVPYLYEREGTSCENLPETHAFLKELRGRIDDRYEDRMLLAEANQWPEDAVAYFGKGDECHMAFHFPVMPRLFMAVHMEDRFPILDILDQTPSIPDSCQWAIFLRNHDELTLEMVTDEERDYMWRVYAADRRARINLGIRRRLAPLMGNNRRKIELMNALLFSLNGTPIVYYGDEIGMGDNHFLGDRNGVRTPMQWSPDRNGGFSRANPQSLFLPVVVDPEYHYEAVNVETQQGNPSSLLWWMKRTLALRQRFRCFGRGTLEPLTPSNRRVLAFLRRYENECVLVVANLSRFSQYVELDLSEFQGVRPLELFGNVPFPPVGELPYLLTLGPHAFYWFSLSDDAPGRERIELRSGEEPPPLRAASLRALLTGRARAGLEARLPAFLARQRWFRSKPRALQGTRIVDAVPLRGGASDAGLWLAFVRADFETGTPETYALPLAFHAGEAPWTATVTRVRFGDDEQPVEGRLDEASGDPRLGEALRDLVARGRVARGGEVEVVGVPGGRLGRRLLRGDLERPQLLGREQSNTSFRFGDRLIGKLMRRMDEGTSPEVELSSYLTEVARFPHSPPLSGHVELRRGREEPATLAVFHGLAPNEGDAWTFTLDALEQFLEAELVEGRAADPAPERGLIERARAGVDPEEGAEFAFYLDMARTLGRRTGELHRALAGGEGPALAPERATPFGQRSFYQSLRNLAGRSLDALRAALPRIEGGGEALGRAVLAREDEIRARLGEIRERPGGARIRIHGDFHLGQVLFTGRDFQIIDFEGEPARPLAERRHKRSPLVDVAGMLRSFHYAAEMALRTDAPGGQLPTEQTGRLRPWARHWRETVSAAFLQEWLEAMGDTPLLPADDDDLAALLRIHLLEKALYELGYELDNRPAWVDIPLRGILDCLGPGPERS